jgi:predicted nucleotidyltransferase component of viral defense system
MASSAPSKLTALQRDVLDAPGFKRLVLARGDEGLVIDLVMDVSPQLHAEKLDRDNILIDSADENLANKLAALVGRAAERDLVDVMFLERAGYSIDAPWRPS